KQPPPPIRRGDGRSIQLRPHPYAAAARADGQHTYDATAQEVTAEIHRGLDADSVRLLVDEKLRPMGVLAQRDGSSPSAQKPDPFLGLKFRATIVPESASNAVGTAFKPLFFPPVVLAVLAAFVTFD